MGLSPQLAAHDPSLSVHEQQGGVHNKPGSHTHLTQPDWLVQAHHVVPHAHLGCKYHPYDLEASSADHCSAAHAAELTEAGADQVSHARGNLTHGKNWAGMTLLLWFLNVS